MNCAVVSDEAQIINLRSSLRSSPPLERLLLRTLLSLLLVFYEFNTRRLPRHTKLLVAATWLRDPIKVEYTYLWSLRLFSC